MKNKEKHWDQGSCWEEAESSWDARSKQAAKQHPLKMLKNLPKMPGITADTRQNLRWKALKYMLAHDSKRAILKGFLKRPFRYSWNYLKSLLRKQSYIRDDDFFLYNVESAKAFEALIGSPNSLLVVGFSYCHKPHECPSGRFTDACIHDSKHPSCQQCFIGKAVHALPEGDVIPLFIPTVHYIGEQIFDIVHRYPKRQVLFLITACEMTLEMFADWGNMVGIKGIGVRLDGRICNTMRAFELSEQGIKPGLTVVQEHTQRRILDLIKTARARLRSGLSDTETGFEV